MQTVKVEGNYADRSRYLCIVSHKEEFCLLGVDEEVDEDNTRITSTIGLVCKIVLGMDVTLDGDGGFTYHHLNDQQFIFKPVSVQALWTMIQTLHVIREKLGPTAHLEDDWVKAYESRINSPQSCINEWHMMADILVKRPPSPHRTPKNQQRMGRNRFEVSVDFKVVVKNRLRQIMKTSNLDTVTSKKIRTQLEGDLCQSLEEYKSFIDEEILLILGQMDPASKILEYVYLGSEWNASNLDELRANGITHILNVTKEIDNFYPGDFKYKNIRVYDEEATDLLRYFEDTYRFIKDAKERNGKVLIHCKMGISRSATVTISYHMKEYDKDLSSALELVKSRRSIVSPNKRFLNDLKVYEGILSAFRHRQYYHSRLFRSKSESSLPKGSNEKNISSAKKVTLKAVDSPDHARFQHQQSLLHHRNPHNLSVRPKSWSPNEKVAHFLMEQADRLSKSATADNMVDSSDCNCSFDFHVGPVSAIDPTCECNVELELSVPEKPVNVGCRDPDDLQTDVIVQSLSNLRTSSSLLEDMRSSHGGSVSSSVSSTASVPTTPIFVLKRRSSVDAAFLSSAIIPPAPPPMPATPPSCSSLTKSEVLSVKTLANMFDFKVTPIPMRPCSARLEDNHIFQRMAKQLDNDNETDC